MKKGLTVLVLLAFGLVVNAQEKQGKSEIRFSYGLGTVPQFADLMSDVWSVGLTGGYYKTENNQGTGAIGLEYLYDITPRISLKGGFVYEKVGKDIIIAKVKSGRMEDSYYTVLAGADFNYFQKKTVKLYSGVSGGVSVNHHEYAGQTDTTNLVAYQVDAIGVRFGNKFGGFVNLGFGYKGILNAGLSYKL
ncbi:hypothetical protein FNW52_03335 [Flavobacterium sp. ZT3R18]|uniref:hypothetical protein n=1 Tax=Flavobacterium sp. ZT3R18 TaxID=2594429 RepID=UPI00117A0607|nr:hypothetical protein [Flavobacterium sp. ZT3R18]TRX37946.1 hypothetical protein FNW52_03335 [Flavobacterium sp. ZT3R18]